jgi:hypothetical protein
MAARVLSFGMDDCNRSLVLRAAGYEVGRCCSLIDFRIRIRERPDAEAVLVAEEPGTNRREVVTLTREHSQARLILFDNSNVSADEAEFDLIIPPQMPPDEWLRQIASAIEQSRALNATSAMIREQSALLKKDAEIPRLKSKIERQRSATARAEAERLIRSIPQTSDPDPSDE